MPITIGANIASLRTQRQLGQTTDALARVYERLSSGQRINHASDDAAGLSIASQLTSGARVLGQAIRNLNDGISLTAIAEGALSSMTDIAVRQLELAEEAANGTFSTRQRAALQKEATELSKEFNRIVESTTFNGRQVFDLNSPDVTIQAGYGAAGALSVDLTSQLKRLVGSGTFSEVASYGLSQASGVITGDFNEDGIPDFATIGGNLSVAIGNGDGTFRTGTSFVVGGGYLAVIQTADLNNDGNLDLVVTRSSNEVDVLLGNGNGTFNLQIPTYLGATVNGLALSDVDGDGNLDGIFGTTTGSVVVMAGNGNGTFRASATLTGFGNMNSISTGDFNGDGKTDIVASTYNNATLVYFGNGGGSFASAVNLSNPGASSRVAVGDFNGDAISDIVIATYSGLSAVTYFGSANQSLTAGPTITTANGVYTLKVGDINGDRQDDIVVMGYGGGSNVYFGNGNGTFRQGATFGSPGGAYEIGLADFNRDGRIDLVSASWAFANTQVFLSDPAPVLTIAPPDLSSVLSARGALEELRGNLARVQAQLGAIGATTSRFDAELRNLESQRVNYVAAADRISSADFAAESASLVRHQILQQAASAVLAQANQQPSLALQLLTT